MSYGDTQRIDCLHRGTYISYYIKKQPLQLYELNKYIGSQSHEHI